MLQVQELSGSFSRSPLLSLGSLPDVQDHDCDCSWGSEEDDTDGERGVIIGSMPQGRVSGDLGDDDVAPADGISQESQAAPEQACAAGAGSSPVMVSGSLSSAELASTGVSGWEIVEQC